MSDPVTIKGGRVELELDDGRVIVSPPDHYLVHDPSGQVLDSCELYVGPARLTNKRVTDLTPEQRWYFGFGYDARKALLDVPVARWCALGATRAIEFFRSGRHEGDWRHEFGTPQPLLRSGQWLKLKLPTDCKLTHKGIEKP
jgi:hypothetical protein